MIGNFRQVSQDELEKLLREPERIEEFIYPEGEEEPEILCIDKAWDGIRFLLTGNSSLEEYPNFDPNNLLNNVIFGGQTLGENIDLGYGPCRYLTPAQVVEVNQALLKITKEELVNKYNSKIFQESEIYPFKWEEADLEYLLEYWNEIILYYRDASNRGNGMLFYIN